ncbi:hypothetical protein HU200_012518 [Digitaria exilis]|uniref:Uncharacterized protein n=1 Tax=Digitaria exilis TaxID=1010633 RepID=A0A835AF19_9POAL|nr:hypothetical protein HU200_061405 [Digitaria exilis]KAF8749912.1 hypothetical protein HU200_012518 [Digitaria exilis]
MWLFYCWLSLGTKKERSSSA